jgi:hypothetical protein
MHNTPIIKIINILVDIPPYPEEFFSFKDLIIFPTSLAGKDLIFMFGNGFEKILFK